MDFSRAYGEGNYTFQIVVRVRDEYQDNHNKRRNYMRKCPKCSKAYDDSWKICLSCNDTALIDAPNIPIALSNVQDGEDKKEPTMKDRYEKPSLFSLRLILVLWVLWVIAYYVLYFVYIRPWIAKGASITHTTISFPVGMHLIPTFFLPILLLYAIFRIKGKISK